MPSFTNDETENFSTSNIKALKTKFPTLPSTLKKQHTKVYEDTILEVDSPAFHTSNYSKMSGLRKPLKPYDLKKVKALRHDLYATGV